ncbi:Trm112 family protein [Naumannella halotolerans]|uniref:UPF0434 protein CLV29_1748 n=1 Tax=Naumannella halotolerans TaxID=993414 RepID=A0A4R7JAZ3_9ACTN|nr:Trm112 family protein [Naumannella halotolerans]TDT34096.1 hypothetical protein CLV29_1748 [Naumannella halotolerans]
MGVETTAGLDLPGELLELLACPRCRARLAVDHETSELVCLGTECGLAYPVHDRIPVLLVDEARPTLAGYHR